MQIDPISSPMASSKTFQILDASPMRQRRKWSKAAKDRIIEEACAPDANVSAIARAHGMLPAQLFRWRKLALKESQAASSISPAIEDRKSTRLNSSH